jgi:glycerophosphoryl diester phosphodiesterase
MVAIRLDTPSHHEPFIMPSHNKVILYFSSCCLLWTACAALAHGDEQNASSSTGASPNTAQKLVIAHRGASGYLPEHTLEAYALAFAQGADFIEPDVVISKDGVLVCNHDIYMQDTTNVSELFPDRARADGRYYFIDFTLAELKKLSMKGRRDSAEPGYQIPTLAEMLTMIRRLNERTGRNVGTIPEPKNPRWHREQGQPLEARLLDQYAAFGMTQRTDPVIVQCFELDALRRMRQELKSDLRMVFLTGGTPDDRTLDDLATFADGIGPALTSIEKDGRSVRDNDLVRRAHQRHLKVIPYTLGNDEAQTRRFFEQYGVDGLFSDFPDVAVRARGARP